MEVETAQHVINYFAAIIMLGFTGIITWLTWREYVWIPWLIILVTLTCFAAFTVVEQGYWP